MTGTGGWMGFALPTAASLEAAHGQVDELKVAVAMMMPLILCCTQRPPTHFYMLAQGRHWLSEALTPAASLGY